MLVSLMAPGEYHFTGVASKCIYTALTYQSVMRTVALK